MLRLTDARTGSLEQIRPSRARLLTVYACAPTGRRYAHVGSLRTFLLTDLIRRVAELAGWQVTVVQNITDAGNRDLAALNIHPADTYPHAPECVELSEAVDLYVSTIDQRLPHRESERAQPSAAAGHDVVRHWVHGEHLLFDGREMAESTGNVVLLADVAGRGHDPLALRLAFLSGRYRHQMNLTWDSIEAADKTLARWRRRVAEWAESPSRPMKAGYVADVREAFEDDLDTPAALRLLRQAERDAAIPAGSKFEMFAHLDRLFGLDLVREVGRLRAAPEPPAGDL
jgi:cysteinyl-tRNA synthetase